MSDKKETTNELTADDKLIHTGQEVGKAIARSTFQAEQTGKKIKKKMEETVARLTPSKKVPKPPKSPFSDSGELALIDKIGFVAGEIFEYLNSNGETATEKLIRAIMSRKNSNAMALCAIGWLAREGKITLSPNGALVTLKSK